MTAGRVRPWAKLSMSEIESQQASVTATYTLSVRTPPHRLAAKFNGVL